MRRSHRSHLNVTAVIAKRICFRNEPLIAAAVLIDAGLGRFRIMSLTLRALLFVGLSAASVAILALPYLSIH